MSLPETFKDGVNPSTGKCRIDWVFQLGGPLTQAFLDITAHPSGQPQGPPSFQSTFDPLEDSAALLLGVMAFMHHHSSLSMAGTPCGLLPLGEHSEGLEHPWFHLEPEPAPSLQPLH